MSGSAKNLVTISEFEETVKRIEKVVVIVRANRNAKILPYDYVKKAASNMSLNDFLVTRIYPRTKDLQVSVYDGNFSENPHGKTSMGKLRDGYIR